MSLKCWPEFDLRTDREFILRFSPEFNWIYSLSAEQSLSVSHTEWKIIFQFLLDLWVAMMCRAVIACDTRDKLDILGVEQLALSFYLVKYN